MPTDSSPLIEDATVYLHQYEGDVEGLSDATKRKRLAEVKVMKNGRQVDRWKKGDTRKPPAPGDKHTPNVKG